jgi:protocatechuate 3,4-dioxygenase beta subunit
MSTAVSAEMAALLARGATTCRLWAEQDEGPYRRDHNPLRRDVTDDRVGAPLALGLGLGRLDGTALADAVVEIWHCDAAGRYSGFPPPGPGAGPAAGDAPRTEYLAGQMFLRGRQATDPDGRVEFRTIYPGWYPGRTVHIHVIARTDDATFTSQLYFPEPVTEAVFARAPYSQRPGRDTTNATDTIFSTGGRPAVLDVEAVDGGYRAGSRLVLPGA